MWSQSFSSYIHPRDGVLIETFHTKITYGMMRCLRPREWLNEVTNFYFQLLVEVCSTAWNRIHVFTTFFVDKCTKKQ